MNKLSNKFIKSVRYLFLMGVSVLGLMAIIGTGGGGGGDPCAGSVPCLTVDSENTFYVFEDQRGEPVMVMSDGAIAVVVGTWDDGQGNLFIIGLGGSVTDCHNAVLCCGTVDLNDNGNIDPGEEFASVSGDMNICNVTLTISNMVLDGNPHQDIVATYTFSGTSSLSGTHQIDREPPIKFLQKVMEGMSVE